jgi:hypothetical protein
MPILGECRNARELGFPQRCIFQWVACDRCGAERWMRRNILLRHGGVNYCNKCHVSVREDVRVKKEHINMWDGIAEPKLGQVCNAQLLGFRNSIYMYYVCCPMCNIGRWVQKTSIGTMCLDCRHKHHGAKLSKERNPNWVGGKIKSGQYIKIMVDKDSPYFCMAAKGYVPEHRLVMAMHLGRPLEKWEVVHHINRVKNDNRIENLELIESVVHHVLLTRMEIRISNLEKRVMELESENILMKSWLELKNGKLPDALVKE